MHEKHIEHILERVREYGTGMNPIVIRPGNTVRFAEKDEIISVLCDVKRLVEEVEKLTLLLRIAHAEFCSSRCESTGPSNRPLRHCKMCEEIQAAIPKTAESRVSEGGKG